MKNVILKLIVVLRYMKNVHLKLIVLKCTKAKFVIASIYIGVNDWLFIILFVISILLLGIIDRDWRLKLQVSDFENSVE